MSNLITATVGLIDSFSWFSFFLGFEPSNYYNVAIIFKLLLLVLFSAGKCSIERLVKPGAFAFICLLCAYISLLSSTDPWRPLFKLTGFFSSLLLTCLFLSKETYVFYFRGAVFSLFTCFLIFAGYALTGKLSSEYGRFLFFNESHPNTGGEYFAAGALSALLGARNLSSTFLISAFFLGSCMLQSRAAMLTTVFLFGFSLFLYYNSFYIRLALVFVLGGAGLGLISSEYLQGSFAVSNEGRGLESGFSGRTDIYKEAMKIFIDNPIIGSGFGHFDGYNKPYVHNFFLQGFAEFGLLFIFIFIILVLYLFFLGKTNLTAFICVILFFPLIFFNARFLNLNPFPFFIYVILCKKL